MLHLLLLLLLGYLLLVATVWLLQGFLVFPGAGRGDRGLPDLPSLRSGTLQRPGGETFRTVTVRSPAPRGFALLFGGNGEDLTSLAYQAAELARHRLVVLAAEFPGYGLSQGMPTVASILECAEVAARAAASQARQEGLPLLVAGSSLGSFAAVHVAACGTGERLLLRSPPTTLAAAADARFWWLPVRWLLRHGFDNLTPAPRVAVPALVLHGDRDRIVPLALGQELATALPQGRLVTIAGCGHNDLGWGPDGPGGPAVAAFLDGR